MSFQRGDHTLLTYDRAQPARTELILPVTVLEDSPTGTMVYLSAGTRTQVLILADGSTPPRDTPYSELARMERIHGDSVWTSTDVLICWQPDWTWDVRLMWDSTSGTFLCWYVNIQDEIRRTGPGFSSTDHFLDIVVAQDKTWRLKDEAEFEDAVQLGMYTDAKVANIRNSLDQAINHVESQGWPFNTELERFTPDHDWSLPVLSR